MRLRTPLINELSSRRERTDHDVITIRIAQCELLGSCFLDSCGVLLRSLPRERALVVMPRRNHPPARTKVNRFQASRGSGRQEEGVRVRPTGAGKAGRFRPCRESVRNTVAGILARLARARWRLASQGLTPDVQAQLRRSCAAASTSAGALCWTPTDARRKTGRSVVGGEMWR